MTEALGAGEGGLLLEPVRIIYLLGAARSGTSLFTSLLGELDGVFAAAEMRLLWRGYDSRRCGCGAPVAECPVWCNAARGARAVAGFDEPDRFMGLQLATTRNRHLSKLLGAPVAPDAAAYLRVMESMYLSLAEASGARVIVDSSKSAAEAALLLFGTRTLTYPVHIVRDPRAVVYSWERAGRRKPKSQKSTPRAAAGWLASNLAAELTMRKYPYERRLRVRYEDYVKQPGEALASVAKLVGVDTGDMAFLSGAHTARASRHMVGGNPLRFEEQVVTLEPDTEWLRRMPPARSALIAGMTLPLFMRYGYSFRAAWAQSLPPAAIDEAP